MHLKSVEQRLKQKGYKLTNQRKAILQVLFQYKNHFLSAEEIYLQVKKRCQQTNFSTIYRNLEMLEKIEMIHKTNVYNGVFRYELICHDAHHHHIICKSCGKTTPIDFCPLKDLYPQLQDQNFTLTDHKFELYGYCEKCQASFSDKK
ncbi:Fur family transcriptional regulator [Clostridiaceae bacterium 35-E11]